MLVLVLPMVMALVSCLGLLRIGVGGMLPLATVNNLLLAMLPMAIGLR